MARIYMTRKPVTIKIFQFLVTKWWLLSTVFLLLRVATAFLAELILLLIIIKW